MYKNIFIVLLENGDIFAIFKKVITDQMSKEQLQIRVNQLDGINQELREAVTKLQSLQAISPIPNYIIIT